MIFDVDRIISSMTLEQKVGQLFTMGFSGGVVTPLVIKMIRKLHCGGLRITPNVKISFGKYEMVTHNSKRSQDVVPPPSPYLSPRTHLEYINELQRIAVSENNGVPLHISADWEGGIGVDITRAGYPLLPAAMGFACSKDTDLIYRTAKAGGDLLRATGITNIHSPVVDINVNPNNPEINIRSYGDTPAKVIKYAKAAFLGFRDAGIVCTAKHFPGRGDSEHDAHYHQIVCNHSKKHLLKNELYPYVHLIKEGLPSIMLGHIICPTLGDSQYPASISKTVIQEFIRKELGFEGVLTTDSMTMQGISRIMQPEKAAALAIAAGCDLVLYKSENIEELKIVFDNVFALMKTGQISEQQINASVRRILLMKADIGLFKTKGLNNPDVLQEKLSSTKIQKIIKEAAIAATLLIRDRKKILPINQQKKILVVEQAMFVARSCNDEYFHSYMLWEIIRRYYPEADLYELDFYGNDDDIAKISQMASQYDIVIATNIYSRGAMPNTGFLKKLADKIKRLVVITNTPYSLTVTKNMDSVLCVFSEFTPSLEIAVDIILGKRSAGRKWPVNYKLT